MRLQTRAAKAWASISVWGLVWVKIPGHQFSCMRPRHPGMARPWGQCGVPGQVKGHPCCMCINGKVRGSCGGPLFQATATVHQQTNTELCVYRHCGIMQMNVKRDDALTKLRASNPKCLNCKTCALAPMSTEARMTCTCCEGPTLKIPTKVRTNHESSLILFWGFRRVGPCVCVCQ
jgi:hypothetical protein